MLRCARCGWPVGETAVLSTHPTSQGWVRYRRCICGALAIELVRPAGEDAAMQVEAVREAVQAR